MEVQTAIKYPAGRGQITVTEIDLACLQPGRYLNDNIINMLLKWFSKASNKGRDEVRVADTFEMSALENFLHRGRSLTTKCFRTQWTLLPICTEAHWFAAGVQVAEGKAKIFWADSIRKIKRENTWNTLKEAVKLLLPTLHTIEEVHLEVPQQTNSTDCGLYVLANIRAMLISTTEKISIDSEEGRQKFKRPLSRVEILQLLQHIKKNTYVQKHLSKPVLTVEPNKSTIHQQICLKNKSIKNWDVSEEEMGKLLEIAKETKESGKRAVFRREISRSGQLTFRSNKKLTTVTKTSM